MLKLETQSRALGQDWGSATLGAVTVLQRMAAGAGELMSAVYEGAEMADGLTARW